MSLDAIMHPGRQSARHSGLRPAAAAGCGVVVAAWTWFAVQWTAHGARPHVHGGHEHGQGQVSGPAGPHDHLWTAAGLAAAGVLLLAVVIGLVGLRLLCKTGSQRPFPAGAPLVLPVCAYAGLEVVEQVAEPGHRSLATLALTALSVALVTMASGVVVVVAWTTVGRVRRIVLLGSSAPAGGWPSGGCRASAGFVPVWASWSSGRWRRGPPGVACAT